MSDSEESPQKRRKVETSPSSSPLSWLPEDLVISILARLSRVDHAALSLSSKSCRHLVASPDLYKMRSLMGRNETYLYVCLRTPPPDPNTGWYILRRKRTLDASSSDLIPIPSSPSQAPEASSVVVLDWGIYVIGGLIEGKPTSAVWLLDCRTHTWHSVPSMGVARANAAAGVVDGKIYVLGGCTVDDYNKLWWGVVFDPKAQTWATLPQMPHKRHKNIHSSVVRDHKVYAVVNTDSTFYYSPREGQWGRGNLAKAVGNQTDMCMINNLLFCIASKGTLWWYDPHELDLRGSEPTRMHSNLVKGLDSLKNTLASSRVVHFDQHFLDFWEQSKILFGITQKRDLVDVLAGARLSNSGGNIVLFWDVIEGDRLEIWCAEISLERRGGDIWGTIQSSNAVMTVHPFLDHYKITAVSGSIAAGLTSFAVIPLNKLRRSKLTWLRQELESQEEGSKRHIKQFHQTAIP